MFTRCPQCKSVHPLSAELLARARGLVQCSECDRIFSALSFLFDEWPSGQAHGPAKGPNAAPPVIGPGQKDKDSSEDPSSASGKEEKARKRTRLAWGLATALLVLMTIANTAWTFRDPLLEHPRVSGWLNENGWSQVEQDGLLKDSQQIQLISRDIHTHPTRSGILVLSLTFVNLAPRVQEFPVLEITLLDAAGQPVARRRLQPGDYLRPGADIEAGLAADVYLPVLLELGDPGNRAVGFEINFM